MSKYFFFTVLLNSVLLFASNKNTPVLLPRFPIIIDSGYLGTAGYRPPIIADFDNDNCNEIIVSTRYPNPSKDKIHIIKKDGTYLPGWPKFFNSSASLYIAVGDIDGDGKIDICSLGESLYVFNSDGVLFPGFPIFVRHGYTLTLFDIDNDKKLEIITQSDNSILVYNHTGRLRNGWPQFVPWLAENAPAVGDLNNDGKAEIVIASRKFIDLGINDSNTISVFQENGESFPGWPIIYNDSGYSFYASNPSIVPTSPYGSLIIVNANRYDTVTTIESSRMLVFLNNGTLLHQWHLRNAQSGTFALADINNDNIIESVTKVWYPSDIVVSSLNGYNIPTQRMYGAYPLVVKLSQQSPYSILTNSNSALNDSGFIYVYNSDGTPLPWSPLRVPGFPQGNNIFGDINNDSTIELITITEQGTNPAYTYLYAWTFPNSYASAENLPWPMYRHDRYRTSQYGFVPPDNIVGVPTSEENIPSAFSLAQNYPNPFNPKTTIHYTLSTAALVTLKVYDVLGREIATLFNNENKDAGKFAVQFDASNVSSGIYFYRLSVTQLGKLRYTETKKFVVMK